MLAQLFRSRAADLTLHWDNAASEDNVASEKVKMKTASCKMSAYTAIWRRRGSLPH